MGSTSKPGNGEVKNRIVVVGDEGVGKSSLLVRVISNTFQLNVSPLLPIATLAPNKLSKEPIFTALIDTSSRPNHINKLEEEIRKASSICIVYDITKAESLDRVREHWIPEIRRICHHSATETPPLIVAANMKDKIHLTDEMFQNQNDSLLDNCQEIDYFLACSAKTGELVQEMFQHAQTAFLYPSKPVFNKAEKKFTPKVSLILKRLFLLSDMDRDGHLSDLELRTFLLKCFELEIAPDVIEKTKATVKKTTPEGVSEKGLNFQGFLCLIHNLSSGGSFRNLWTILRKYGYGDDLNFRQDFLYPQITVKNENTTELSSKGFDFLTKIFSGFCSQSGELTAQCWTDLFEPSPAIPKMFSKKLVSEGKTSLSEFLAQWQMLSYLDYKTSIAYFSYLGYPGASTEGIKITPGKKEDMGQGKPSKSVFLIFVFGSQGSGKTTFLNGLIGKSSEEIIPTSTSGNRVCGNVKQDYLILEEIIYPVEIEDASRMSKCDLFCFLYDPKEQRSLNLAQHLEQYRVTHYPNTPSIIFQTKEDQTPPLHDQWKFVKGEHVKISKQILTPQFYEGLLVHITNQYKHASIWTRLLHSQVSKRFTFLSVASFSVMAFIFWAYRSQLKTLFSSRVLKLSHQRSNP